MRILITGGAGQTARPLIDILVKANHEIIAFDIQEADQSSCDGKIISIIGDICDAEEINHALANVDAIIHLAVNTMDVNNAELSFKINALGTYNLLMQSRKNNIKKILIASSAPVHMLNEILKLKNIDINYYCSPDDDFIYDLTKNLQEVIALNFAQTYLMDIMVLRLGHIVDGITHTDLHGNPLSNLIYCHGGWVCRYDVARAFLKAIQTDFNGFHLLNIIGSYQATALFNLSATKDVIGFECKEKFLDYTI